MKFTKYIKTENISHVNEQVNEAEDVSDIKVVILCTHEESDIIPFLKKKLKDKNIDTQVINIRKCILEKDEESGDYKISDDKTKDYNINSDDTVIFTRGLIKGIRSSDIIYELQDNGFFVTNTIDSIKDCENKYLTTRKLQNAEVSIPRTSIIQDIDLVEYAVEKVGGNFPVVLKTLTGLAGIGVSIIESLQSLKSVLQTIWKMDPEMEMLIQEMIDSEYDLRVHVIIKDLESSDENGAYVIGAMRRNKINKDFRTNYSLGATVEAAEITKDQEDLAISAAKAMGCNWCGVDIIVDADDKSYVLEVNSTPGVEGFNKATGKDISEDISDFILNKDNWSKNQKTK
jgi:ribosomal protein S6--L-glutamate ligase